MKIRTIIALGVAGAYYAHRRRGGELTLASIQDSLKVLRDRVEELAHVGKQRATEATQHVADRAQKHADDLGTRSSTASPSEIGH